VFTILPLDRGQGLRRAPLCASGQKPRPASLRAWAPPSEITKRGCRHQDLTRAWQNEVFRSEICDFSYQDLEPAQTTRFEGAFYQLPRAFGRQNNGQKPSAAGLTVVGGGTADVLRNT